MIKKILQRIYGKLARILRYIRLEKYRRKYGFHKWHMIPKIQKPYIQDIIKHIKNSSINEQTTIVECGCGMCDILSNKAFKNCQRLGVEKDKRVFDALKELYKKETMKFINGSFQDIKHMKINWLIAVNFTHEISDEEMETILKDLVQNNDIENIILDEVTGNYKYSHDYSTIIPSGYITANTWGGYEADGGERRIKIFEKRTGDYERI